MSFKKYKVKDLRRRIAKWICYLIVVALIGYGCWWMYVINHSLETPPVLPAMIVISLYVFTIYGIGTLGYRFNCKEILSDQGQLVVYSRKKNTPIFLSPRLDIEYGSVPKNEPMILLSDGGDAYRVLLESGTEVYVYKYYCRGYK